MRIAIVVAVLFAAIGTLVGLGIVAGSIPTYELADFLKKEYRGGKFQVYAKVASIESEVPLRFTVRAKHNPDITAKVVSSKGPPENFAVGREVGLRADRFDPETRTLYVYRIETACPSRYEATREAQEAARPAQAP